MKKPKTQDVIEKLIVVVTEMSKAVNEILTWEHIPNPLPDSHVIKLFERIVFEITWLYINLPCLDQTFTVTILCDKY